MKPHLTQDQIESAECRRTAFLAAIPSQILQAEDKLPQKIRTLNASTKSKLGHIYRLMDDLSKVRSPFVACGIGCASCCRMNVTITSAEAHRIAQASGRRTVNVSRSIHHPAEKFAGTPCPFLDDQNRCSTYENRPLACRIHASFFEDASPCHPSVMLEVIVPQIGFSGLEGAMAELEEQSGEGVVADIRDFFPTT